MILDTSAVIALLLRERGHERIETAIESAGEVGIGTPTALETVIVMTGRVGYRGHLDVTRFLEEVGAEPVSFERGHWHAASEAYGRFGKGRHRAGLNYGDCMSYATARLAEQPLLFTGNDFALTDIPAA